MLMAFIPYDDLRLDAHAESICSKGATTLTQSTNCISLSQSRRWASWRCSLRAGGHIQKKQKQNKWAINRLTKLQCRVDEEQAKIRLFKQEANSPDFLIENSATKVFNPLRCAHEYRRFVHHHEPNGGFPEVSECVLEVIVRQRYLELLAQLSDRSIYVAASVLRIHTTSAQVQLPCILPKPLEPHQNACFALIIQKHSHSTRSTQQAQTGARTVPAACCCMRMRLCHAALVLGLCGTANVLHHNCNFESH